MGVKESVQRTYAQRVRQKPRPGYAGISGSRQQGYQYQRLIDTLSDVATAKKLKRLEGLLSAGNSPELRKIAVCLQELAGLLPDDDTGIDFANSRRVFESDPFIRHPEWRKQLELSSENLALVRSELTLCDAQTLQQDYFPQWQVKTPEVTLQKRRSRGQVLAIHDQGNWLYPVEQFIAGAAKPEVYAALLIAMKECKAGGLTDLEMMHWLVSVESTIEPRVNHELDEAIRQGSFADAMAAIAEKGPAQKVLYTPLSLVQQGYDYGFAASLHAWLHDDHAEIVERKDRIEQWKALLSVEGINPRELLESGE